MADGKDNSLVELILCGEYAPRAPALKRFAYSVGFSVLGMWWIVVIKEVFHYNKGKLEGNMPVWGYAILLLAFSMIFYLWTWDRCLPAWSVARWIILYVVSIQIIVITFMLLA
jgi:hypothetical protein